MTNQELKQIKTSLINKKSIKSKDLIPFLNKLIILLEKELNNYKNEKNYSYTLLTIPYFYEALNCNKINQKDINEKLLQIRSKIQRILKQTKNNEQSINNRKILKKLIGKIEIISLTLTNSYDANFLDHKLDLIYYLVFSIKNIDVLKSILKKAPHQINILDKKGAFVIRKIVESYLNCLKFHVKDEKYEGLDDLLYFDRVLSIVLNHNKEYINSYHIKKLDLLFQKQEKYAPASNILKERYFYFIYKWRELFSKYLKEENTFFYANTLYQQKEINYQYMIYEEFSLESNLIANSLFYTTKFPKIKSYLPNVYTIDGAGTKELDDGFSCYKENNIYHLGIHITNPMAYLKEDNLLFQNACKRVSAVYKKKHVIPMFPSILSMNLFSLNENNIRHAINFLIDIDLEKNEIINFEILLEPIYVKKNDTYSNCNLILNNKNSDLEYIETLSCIKEILPFIKKFYSIDKLYAKMKRIEANTTNTNVIGSTTSETIIEALMIFTNFIYAKYASELEIPILYRNHEVSPFYKEELNTYEKMINKGEHNQIYQNEINILKSKYPSSYYGITNVGHFGLGISYYTHITSPDRRVADCLNILMLQKYLNGTLKLKEELEKLNTMAKYINERNHSIDSYVKEYVLKMKKNVK